MILDLLADDSYVFLGCVVPAPDAPAFWAAVKKAYADLCASGVVNA